MNLLIISFSVNGAMGDSMRQFVIGLSKYTSINITLLTNKNIIIPQAPNVKIENIEFDRKKIFSFLNPISYINLFQKIRRYHLTTDTKVLFWSFHPVNLLLFKVLKLESIYFYLHDHEIHSGVGGIDAKFINKQLMFLYNHNVTLLVSSNWMKSEVLKKNRSINANRIHVLYLGLLENFIMPYSNLEENIDILFFGRLEYYKGLDILFDAIKLLSGNYKIVVVSKGDFSSVYGGNIKVPQNVLHINKYVPDSELAQYIQRSRLIVMPYRDATGTQVIQTVFYYNKPIVATNVGCFPEYIKNGIDGFVVEKENPLQLAEKIRQLLEDPTLRKNMGNNGKLRLETDFSNKNISFKFQHIINRD